MANPKILVVVSTVREGRTGRMIADWYINEARANTSDLDFEILDLSDLDLPLFDEPTPPLYHQYSEIQNRVAEIVESADGFVFIAGEYNFSLPGSLKNFLDYVYLEWEHRPATFVGYGVHGGVRAIKDLTTVLSSMGVPVITKTAYTIHIDSPWSAFDEEGNLRAELVKGDVASQVAELALWLAAFAHARDRATVQAA